MELWKTIRNKFAWMKKKVSHSKKGQTTYPPANIQNLPEELLLEIFSHLSLGELCNTVPKVCTQWERLHWDPQLYSIPIPVGERSIEDIFKYLYFAIYLASPYFGEVYIREIIYKCLNIRHEVKHRTKEYKDLIIVLSHSRIINLNGSSIALWTDSKRLAPLLEFCVQLERVKICRNNRTIVNNAELISLCDKLSGTLRMLHTNCYVWTVEVARALNKYRLLEQLTIHASYNLSAECLLEIANLPSLRRLSINHCNIAKTDWIPLFSNDALKDLTHLHLKDIQFNDKAAVAIGSNLKNLIVLYIITYYQSGIGNDGLRSIIQGCNKLTSLELKCSGSRSIVDDIMLIPKHLPRLQTLAIGLECVSSSTRSANWQSALKKKMPGLVVRELVGYQNMELDMLQVYL